MKKLIAGFAVAFLALSGAVVGVAIPAAATVIDPPAECIPSDGIDAWDETIADAYDETIAEAYDEVISEEHWQRYSANGSWKEDFAPDFPSDYWQPNVAGDPHGIGVAGPYYVSNENSGNVDWFYLELVPAEIIHHDAIIEHHDAIIEHHDAVPPVVCPPDDDETPLIVPSLLTPNDVCGTENDGYVLPEDTNDIDYWTEDNGDIIAALKTPGAFLWSIVNGSGWSFDDDNTIRFTYVPAGERGSVFTDVPCGEVCEITQVPVWHVWTGGPILGDDGPAADDEGWNPNSGDPQSANHAYENHTAGVPYFVSHGNSGNGDWFLWTLEDCPPPPTDTPVPALFDYPAVAPTCTAAESFDGEFFPYQGNGFVLDVDRPYDGPGDYTLTATADEGFEFTEDSPGEGDSQVRTLVITLSGELAEFDEEGLPCLTFIVPDPAAPGFTDVCAVANDVLTIPADTEFVTYAVTDSRVAGVGSVTVVAELVFEDDEFAEGAVTEWTFAFTNAACPTTTPPTTPTDKLAFTGLVAGNNNPLIAGVLAVLTVGAAMTLYGARRRRS